MLMKRWRLIHGERGQSDGLNQNSGKLSPSKKKEVISRKTRIKPRRRRRFIVPYKLLTKKPFGFRTRSFPKFIPCELLVVGSFLTRMPFTPRDIKSQTRKIRASTNEFQSTKRLGWAWILKKGSEKLWESRACHVKFLRSFKFVKFLKKIPVLFQLEIIQIRPPPLSCKGRIVWGCPSQSRGCRASVHWHN